MAAEIRPTRPDEIAELSRLLTEGFHTPAEACFAAPEVLHWKYFEPRGSADVPRSYIAVEEGRIIGHIGLTAETFVGDAMASGEVPTLHMFDWLSARRGTPVGASLLLRSHRGFRTAYGIGGNESSWSVGLKGGYKLVGTVPVFRRVLRLRESLRSGGAGRLAKDLVRRVMNPRHVPRGSVKLTAIAEFGAGIAPILDQYKSQAVFTNRLPERLNHMLRFPKEGSLGGLYLATDAHVDSDSSAWSDREPCASAGSLTVFWMTSISPSGMHQSMPSRANSSRREPILPRVWAARCGWPAPCTEWLSPNP